MELKKSAINSSLSLQDSLVNNDKLITLEQTLELPDGAGFESEYVRVGLEAMIQLCESRLELLNSRRQAGDKRFRNTCDIEFVL